MTLTSIRNTLAALKARLPKRHRPVAFIFEAADGSLPGDNARRLQEAETAGAQIIRLRFMAPPSEELSS